jgi:hypothetical protein
MSKARYATAGAGLDNSRFAKSDDDVSFQRDVREKRPSKGREQSQKYGGCRPPATPSGPPLTNTLQAPHRDPPQE